jgi:hypothetical protein
MFFKRYNPKRCVISLGINSNSPSGCPPKAWQDFPRGIKRIRERLCALGFEGDFIGWDKDLPAETVSFGPVDDKVKPFCFLEAYRRGYELVLWVDASAYFKRNPEPLFRLIEKRGYLFIEAGHSVGEFCSDAALISLGISREKSFSLNSLWGAVFGLDLRNSRSFNFLVRLSEKAADGITFYGAKHSGVNNYPVTCSADPRVRGFRKQIIPSVIAYDLGMTKWMNKKELVNKYISIEREYVRVYDEFNGKVEQERVG